VIHWIGGSAELDACKINREHIYIAHIKLDADIHSLFEENSDEFGYII
jgi:hypothetical protein